MCVCCSTTYYTSIREWDLIQFIIILYEYKLFLCVSVLNSRGWDYPLIRGPSALIRDNVVIFGYHIAFYLIDLSESLTISLSHGPLNNLKNFGFIKKIMEYPLRSGP